MNKTYLNDLVEAFLKADNSDKVHDLLTGLLTPAELDEISHRLQIVKLLKAGVPQRNIAEKLNVGIATVTRGSRELKNGRFSQIKASVNTWRNSTD